MPRFHYQARSGGLAIEGVLEATGPSQVAAMLGERGAVPIKIEAARDTDESRSADRAVNWKSLWTRQRVSIEELILLSQQLRSLMRAGIPIARAIRGLSESSSNPRLTALLNDVVEDLEAGVDLASSLGRHRDVFSDLYVSVVHVGENTGRMDQAFEQVGQYLHLERDTKRRFSAATRYPLFVMLSIAVAIGIINVFVIPAFEGVFAKYGADLPWQTRALIGMSEFTVAYWPYLLAAAVGGWFGFRHWRTTPDGHIAWDRFKLRIPIIGAIFDGINLNRFCLSFAMVLRSGLPLIQGLTLVGQTIGNAYLASRINDMRSGIERGDSIARTASASGLFSAVVLQMIAVGEETGRMEDLLWEAAQFYSEEVDYRLKTLSDAIEPVMVIAIAGLVLIMALGVFLPLWDLSSVALK